MGKRKNQQPRGTNGKFVRNSESLNTFSKLPATLAPVSGVNHITTFQGINATLVNRIYRNPDVAMQQSYSDAAAMRFDTLIMECIQARQLATAQLPWTIEADNPRNITQAYVSAEVTKMINRIPRFLEFKRNLLEAIWFGHYGVAMDYGWHFQDNKGRMLVKDWTPIHGDKLYFQFDTGRVGYLKGYVEPSEDVVVCERGRVHLFTDLEREAAIIHKHCIQDGEFEIPLRAGAVQGWGIRSQIFWTWFYRQELIQWLFQALERFGAGGFQIWYFEAGSDASAEAIKEAAQRQNGNHILLVPRYTDKNQQGAGLEILQPNTSNWEFFLKFVDDYFNSQIRKFIVGQELSSTSKASGIGSGNSDFQHETFSKIIRYDSENLQETLTEQLVRILIRHNFPDVDETAFRFKIAVDTPDPDKQLEAIERAAKLGVEVAKDDIRAVLKLRKPAEGEDIVGGSGSVSSADSLSSEPIEPEPEPETKVDAPKQEDRQSDSETA